MKKKGSSGCMKAFLIITGIFVIVIAIGAYYISKNLEPMMKEFGSNYGAEIITEATNQIVNELQLTENEKNEIIGAAAKISEKLKNKEMTLAQMGQVAAALSASKSAGILASKFIESAAWASPDMLQEEKQDATRITNRFAFAIQNGLVSAEQIKQIFKSLEDQELMRTSGDNKTINALKSLSADDLRNKFKEIEELCDKVVVLKESNAADLARQIQKDMREVLNQE